MPTACGFGMVLRTECVVTKRRKERRKKERKKERERKKKLISTFPAFTSPPGTEI